MRLITTGKDHIQSLPEGAYSNQYFTSPALSASNISTVQKLVTETGEVLRARAAQEPSIMSAFTSQFAHGRPGFTPFVSDQSQNSISQALVDQNKFTSSDERLGDPAWAKYSMLPAFGKAAGEENLALANDLSDMDTALRKKSPELALGDKVKEITDRKSVV